MLNILCQSMNFVFLNFPYYNVFTLIGIVLIPLLDLCLKCPIYLKYRNTSLKINDYTSWTINDYIIISKFIQIALRKNVWDAILKCFVSEFSVKNISKYHNLLTSKTLN